MKTVSVNLADSHKFLSAAIEQIIRDCNLFIRIKDESSRSPVNLYKPAIICASVSYALMASGSLNTALLSLHPIRSAAVPNIDSNITFDAYILHNRSII